MQPTSIIDALNESIQNFKIARSRNRSAKPSPGSYHKEISSRKLNSSSSDQENHSFRDPQRHFLPPSMQKDLYQSSHSNYFNNSDSFVKILNGDSITESHSPSKFGQIEAEKTASFTLDHTESAHFSQEMAELFKEISELKNDQKGLEIHIGELENRISKNLRDMHEPLMTTDFSNIISRIGGLQEKFSNRGKSNFTTEKLSSLFEKISNLEQEAEKIKKENNEVENLYHQSLNEIYEKIEKLKGENKALTEIILSSSPSPKHSEIRRKISSESPERNVMYTEISLKKVIEEEKDDHTLDELLGEKQLLEREKAKIEKELNEIPANSKSMANKKKKQTFEAELANIQSLIQAINKKLQNPY